MSSCLEMKKSLGGKRPFGEMSFASDKLSLLSLSDELFPKTRNWSRFAEKEI
jgi:hypothetical protein